MSFRQTQKRYELEVDGHIAYADYRIDAQQCFIDYVFAPPELRGTGAAGKLMQHIVEDTTAKSLIIAPICGYAKSWLQRHQK